MVINVIRSGQLTTVQDLGRRGYRASGVPSSGAMDPFAMRIANLLVGNPGGEAGLELTLTGPELEFSEDRLVAIGGAGFGEIPSWRPWLVKAGERLDLRDCRHGSRAYLAVSGGIAVDSVMGSRSTFLRAGLGGYQGRTLKAGDKLQVGFGRSRGPAIGGNSFTVSASLLPSYSSAPSVRIVRGAQLAEFGGGLCGPEFKISTRSDRMGIRLSGTKLIRGSNVSLLSTAVAPGTVQVPPDGLPIILMADAQTLGGYPLAGHIASVDLPLVAQLRPGDTVRFTEVSVQEAQRLANTLERDISQLRDGIGQKLMDWGN